MSNFTVEQYVDAVESTLQYWLDSHTKADKWAEGWLIDGEAEYTFKQLSKLENNYFSFDWRKSAMTQLARNTRYMYNRCKNCGMLNDGYDCCENPKLGGHPSIGELAEWLIEVDVIPSERELMESLIKDGFKVYKSALKDIIAPVVSEVKDVLKSIRTAKTNEDKLQAVLWGTRVYHVHGNIMSDYGSLAQYEVEYGDIDNIRNNGLESVFSREEISEYLG